MKNRHTVSLVYRLSGIYCFGGCSHGPIGELEFPAGLEDYLHQQETSNFAMVLDTLALSYSEFGGWDFLRNNRFAWHMIMDEEYRPVECNHFLAGVGAKASAAKP